ncbi:MAG: helix-turn-helix domain-containing protein [Blastocatellia bacterium]
MLRESDGTPDGLRALMREQLIPAVERSGAAQLVCLPRPCTSDVKRGAEGIERHHFIELCFCLRGRAEMWVGAQVAICEENQLVVIPSGVEHSTGLLHCVVSSPEDVFSRLVWISIFPFGATINLCESAYGVHRSTPRQLFLSHHTQICADQILAELRQGRAGSELMIKYAFVQMIVSLWRGQPARPDNLPEETALASPPAPEAGLRLSDKVIHHLRRYYYLPDLGLETVARSINSNKSHVSRQFKRETGLTVIEYLHKIRVDAAKRLLLAGLKVSTVAEYVGFSDAYYFSRLFTRVAGCPPSEYRLRPTE